MHLQVVHVMPDEDAKELDRQRRLLCLPKSDIDAIQRETCGRLFQAVSCQTHHVAFLLSDRERKEKKPFAVNLMSSQVLYWAAQFLLSGLWNVHPLIWEWLFRKVLFVL